MKDIINSFKDQKLFFELYYARQSAEQFQSYPSLKKKKKKNNSSKSTRARLGTWLAHK